VASRISFNRTSVHGNELAYVGEAVGTGHSSAKGPFSKLVSDLLRAELGAEDVLLTTSCTSALELAAMLLALEPGDNVIVPSFTFVTTASAFSRAGFELRFADIDPETLCISPESASSVLDPSTRAVVPVHYAGLAADLVGLSEVVATQERCDLIEDNAHGLFGADDRGMLGTTGRFSVLSFHETKNFSCGEGGALVLNEEADVERAHVLYDKGTNRREFLQGSVSRYTWVDQGSSFGMSDLLAAFLLGQLEKRAIVLERRRRLFHLYRDLLSPVQDELGIGLPPNLRGHRPAHHMFYVLVPDPALRDAVLRDLSADGISATFHYQPLHRSLGAQRSMTREFHCPVTDSVSSRMVRLPFFDALEDHQCERVVESLVRALRRSRRGSTA